MAYTYFHSLCFNFVWLQHSENQVLIAMPAGFSFYKANSFFKGFFHQHNNRSFQLNHSIDLSLEEGLAHLYLTKNYKIGGK